MPDRSLNPLEALAAVGLDPVVLDDDFPVVLDEQPIANLDAEDLFAIMNALTLRSDEEQAHPHVLRAKRVLEDIAESNNVSRPCGWYQI